MDPKQALAALETQVIDQCLTKLSKMIVASGNGDWYGQCELKHLSEEVKLAHQVRSLISQGA